MYIVIELQTNADGVVANLVYQYNSRDEAESKFHYILAAAAVSTLPVHAAVMLTNAGTMVKSEYYRHGDEPETAI